jgi:hypothetical protein
LVVATAAAPYGILFLAACGFGSYLVDEVGDEGVGTLTRGILLPTTAVLLLLLVGAIAGLVSAVRQVSATRRLCEHVARNRLSLAGAPAGVEVVDHDAPFAFTFGLGEPRVAVSRGLLDHLSREEVEAVVTHERYHVRARDPLKLVVARTAARTCFFLPAIRPLVHRYLTGRELAADRRSLRNGDRSALAGALFKVTAGPAWGELATAAAMAGPELLAVRVDQLEQGDEPSLPGVPVRVVATSAAVLALLAGIVGAVALQGGMSMMSAADGNKLSAGDVAGAVASGIACTAGWVWLAVVAFRRLGRSG